MPEPEGKDEAFDLVGASRSAQAARTTAKPDGAVSPVLEETAEAFDLKPAPEPAPPPQSEEPPGVAPSPKALLSGEADAHVSRAFNRLATTVLTNNARTLEDLVKDLLMWSGWCGPRSSGSRAEGANPSTHPRGGV
jgi:cell pole-organizing protein PopZ